MRTPEPTILPAFNATTPVMGIVESVSGAEQHGDGTWRSNRRDTVRYVVSAALPEGMARMDDQRSALPMPPMDAPIIAHTPKTLVLGVRMNDAIYWHFMEQWDVEVCPEDGGGSLPPPPATTPEDIRTPGFTPPSPLGPIGPPASLPFGGTS